MTTPQLIPFMTYRVCKSISNTNLRWITRTIWLVMYTILYVYEYQPYSDHDDPSPISSPIRNSLGSDRTKILRNTLGRPIHITGRKRIIGAHRACEQTSVFQLLGRIWAKHMFHAREEQSAIAIECFPIQIIVKHEIWIKYIRIY